MDSKSQSSLTKKMVLPLVFFSAAAGANVTFYGQANRAAMWTDDGRAGRWFFVDNDHSSSRVGVDMAYEQSHDLKFGSKLEFELQSAASNTVSQAVQNGTSAIAIRHVDTWVQNDRWGKLSLGQGSMAADTTMESSFTGTAVVMYSSAQDMCGAMVFHREGSTSREIATDPTTGTVFASMDGLGRQDRLRYDSPVWWGFSVAASATNNAADQFATDVAIRYSGDWWNMFSVKAAVAYTWRSKGTNDSATAATGGTNQGMHDGSFAMIHNNSGWNGNIFWGTQKQTSLGNANLNKVRNMWGIELGKQNEWIACGNTNFAFQFAKVRHTVRNDDHGRTWAGGVVQHMDRANTELYAGFRNHKYSQDIQSFDDVWALMVGMRIKFSAGL